MLAYETSKGLPTKQSVATPILLCHGFDGRVYSDPHPEKSFARFVSIVYWSYSSIALLSKEMQNKSRLRLERVVDRFNSLNEVYSPQRGRPP